MNLNSVNKLDAIIICIVDPVNRTAQRSSTPLHNSNDFEEREISSAMLEINRRRRKISVKGRCLQWGSTWRYFLASGAASLFLRKDYHILCKLIQERGKEIFFEGAFLPEGTEKQRPMNSKTAYPPAIRYRSSRHHCIFIHIFWSYSGIKFACSRLSLGLASGLETHDVPLPLLLR